MAAPSTQHTVHFGQSPVLMTLGALERAQIKEFFAKTCTASGALLSLRKNKDALHVTNEEAKYFRLVFALKLYLKL
ncbi:hypothetical protein ACS0TY_023142 [Phlomoides rotata]